MKKITSVNVLGKKIKIAHKKLDENVLGFFHYEKDLIEINSQCEKKDYAVTLIHEILHATWGRASFIQTDIDQNMQEMIVDIFAKVIDENFKLIKK